MTTSGAWILVDTRRKMSMRKYAPWKKRNGSVSTASKCPPMMVYMASISGVIRIGSAQRLVSHANPNGSTLSPFALGQTSDASISQYVHQIKNNDAIACIARFYLTSDTYFFPLPTATKHSCTCTHTTGSVPIVSA